MTSLGTARTFKVVEVGLDDYVYLADETDIYVNIAILVDAEGILAAYGNQESTADAPIGIGSDIGNYLTMATRHSDTSGQWGPELTISLPVNSTVRWRESTMSLNTQYRAQLYRYVPDDPNQDILSDVTAYTTTVNLPLPNDKDPLNPSLYSGHDYYWQATGQNPGNMSYHWSFMILDKNNNQLGYYTWDPFIEVTS